MVPSRFKTLQLIFFALFFSLVALGKAQDDDDEIREMIRRMLEERDASLNQTLMDIKQQLQGIRNSMKSPPSSRANNNNNNLRGQRQFPVTRVAVTNAPTAPPVDIPALLEPNFQNLGYRIDVLNTSLSKQSVESAQLLLGDLTNLTKSVKDMLEADKEKNRQRTIAEILEAFSTSRLDVVKSLLDDLTKRGLLNSSMSEIVRGMFDDNVDNYGRVTDLFKSTERGQYKSGLSSIIDYFHGNSNPSSNFATPFSSSVSATNSFLDESHYLQLAYLAKQGFGQELKPKFPNLVQNLVWKQKTCIRNAYTNFYLSVNRTEGLKAGGYQVTTRKKSSRTSVTLYCDWEIEPVSQGASFYIRQRNSNSDQSFLNLNALNKGAFAGTDAFNAFHFWYIRLKKDGQAVTLQNVPASSNYLSDFLCSSFEGGTKTRKPVEMLAEEKAISCSWFIDG